MLLSQDNTHDKTRLSPGSMPNFLFFPLFLQPNKHFSPTTQYSQTLLYIFCKSSPHLCIDAYRPDLPAVKYHPRIISVQLFLLSTTTTFNSPRILCTRDTLLSCIPRGLHPSRIITRTSTPAVSVPGTMTASVAPSYSSSLDMDNVHTPARYITLLSIYYRSFICNHQIMSYAQSCNLLFTLRHTSQCLVDANTEGSGLQRTFSRTLPLPRKGFPWLLLGSLNHSGLNTEKLSRPQLDTQNKRKKFLRHSLPNISNERWNLPTGSTLP
ncbi:hypothetical protein BKA67DRAFT_285703 [Truncatella angustata]|uniref:Uncharacterized protein n=1 Tax=Truncatella angustata TaxID=152316 RepID=A0A9P8UMF3_9PEZI|nr:uncharacterized protein BKA67DRAFT_285703 [Truncatella angustata]KAH6654630.1 hypothetical protein BKA67DRAFT_285703 [Truncatella angustata]